MPKYKLTIAYDGTHYGGWQVQPNRISIQDLIQKALKVALRCHTPIVGAGRTDAGVHALGQTAHFEYPDSIDLRKLSASLNGLLPLDIRIKSIEEAPPGFHARYSATGKTYHYHLHLGRILDPFKRFYTTHVLNAVDLALMQEAARLFIGTHDFTSFAHEAHQGSAARDAVRTLRRLDFMTIDGGVRIEIEANGFLYKMVRNIVGTLLDIGSGKINLDSIPLIFDAKDRRLAGKTAPPQGLFLFKVDYESIEITSNDSK